MIISGSEELHYINIQGKHNILWLLSITIKLQLLTNIDVDYSTTTTMKRPTTVACIVYSHYSAIVVDDGKRARNPDALILRPRGQVMQKENWYMDMIV